MIDAVLLAGATTALATTLSLSLIFRHLIHYQQPQYQIHVVRLCWIVPLYSFEALLSLLFPPWEMVLATLRDSYEAYVLYTFMALCIAYVGGEEKLLEVLENKKRIKQPWPLHWMKPLTLDRVFLRRVKQGVLQFVFVKPAMATVALILDHYKVYHENEINFKYGFVYISFITYWAVTISLYCLFLFYLAIRDALEAWNPWPKFLCIKSVVFFSYWQTVTFVILVKLNIIEMAKAIRYQNTIICVEMFLAAIAFEFAFPPADYREDIDHKPPLLKSIKEVVSVHKQVLRDARNTFLQDSHGQVELSNYRRIPNFEYEDDDEHKRAQMQTLVDHHDLGDLGSGSGYGDDDDDGLGLDSATGSMFMSVSTTAGGGHSGAAAGAGSGSGGGSGSGSAGSGLRNQSTAAGLAMSISSSSTAAGAGSSAAHHGSSAISGSHHGAAGKSHNPTAPSGNAKHTSATATGEQKLAEALAKAFEDLPEEHRASADGDIGSSAGDGANGRKHHHPRQELAFSLLDTSNTSAMSEDTAALLSLDPMHFSPDETAQQSAAVPAAAAGSSAEHSGQSTRHHGHGSSRKHNHPSREDHDDFVVI